MSDTQMMSESSIRKKFGLRNTDHLKDGEVLVNGIRFHVYRVLLAAISPVFNEKFKSSSSVKINDIEPDVFQAILDFTLEDKHPVKENVDDAKSILEAAEKYKIKELKDCCERILISNISSENVDSFLRMGKVLHCELLKEKVEDFVVSNEVEMRKLVDRYSEFLGNDTQKKIDSEVNQHRYSNGGHLILAVLAGIGLGLGSAVGLGFYLYYSGKWNNVMIYVMPVSHRK